MIRKKVENYEFVNYELRDWSNYEFVNYELRGGDNYEFARIRQRKLKFWSSQFGGPDKISSKPFRLAKPLHELPRMECEAIHIQTLRA